MNIAQDWLPYLSQEFSKPYFIKLNDFVENAYRETQVYPAKQLIFNAFNLCPYNNVKLVILGQDPYHGAGQAHGLSFSVNDGVAIPPSLKNIYQEIETDLGIKMPNSGNLQRWAEQGVLLLNATLTVEAGKAGSHQKKGWETFTDNIIQQLSSDKINLVFMLWGAYAISKMKLIDTNKHLVLTTTHPSPLSVYRGFRGCKHFSQANKYLLEHNKPQIYF